MQGPDDLSEEAYAEACAKAIQELDFSAEYQEQQQAETNAARAAVGFDPLVKALDEPDVPACDDCGKEYSGKQACSRCKTAFYCSRECQVNAWKGGHKKECANMKAACERTAATTIARMKSKPQLPPYDRVDGLKILDGEGAYRAAVAAGLHAVILDFMAEDEEYVMERFRNPSRQGDIVSLTVGLMNTIFRGGRMEGRGRSNGCYRCVDGQRIKSFVLSDPNAFDQWFDATCAVFLVPLDEQIFANPSRHQIAYMTARDVMAGWIMTLTNRRASKAILLPSREPDDAAVERVKSIAARIKKILTARWNAGDEKDQPGTLEGMLNQVAAMISYWMREFKIDMTPKAFEKLIGLKGGREKQFYLQMAVPLGEATIIKGGTLNNEETQAALAGRGGQRRR